MTLALACPRRVALKHGKSARQGHLAPTQHDLLAASHHAFVSGTNELLAIGSILVLLGSLTALALVRPRDFHEASNPAPRHPNPALEPIGS